MKLVELSGCATYYIEYRGKGYTFIKGKIQQVPPLLANILLDTGDFIDVILDDPAFNKSLDVGGVVPSGSSLTVGKINTVDHIVPLSSLPSDFDKLEVSEDLKKGGIETARDVEKVVKKKWKKRRKENN